jgi:hypothetical protein
MNCIGCKNWRTANFTSYGMAPCKADPDPVLKHGRHFAPQNPCRFGLFEKASDGVIRNRERQIAK